MKLKIFDISGTLFGKAIFMPLFMDKYLLLLHYLYRFLCSARKIVPDSNGGKYINLISVFEKIQVCRNLILELLDEHSNDFFFLFRCHLLRLVFQNETF